MWGTNIINQTVFAKIGLQFKIYCKDACICQLSSSLTCFDYWTKIRKNRQKISVGNFDKGKLFRFYCNWLKSLIQIFSVAYENRLILWNENSFFRPKCGSWGVHYRCISVFRNSHFEKFEAGLVCSFLSKISTKKFMNMSF